MEQRKEIDKDRVLRIFAPWKIALVVILGLGAVVWMFYSELQGNKTTLQAKEKDVDYFWLFMALLVMIGRDVGYILRIKIITQDHLNIRWSFYVIILWEFASAITPSVVGGTLVAIFILNNMGISFGKSLAYVMLTAVLDNLFFIIFGPLVLFLVGLDKINVTILGYDLFWVFGISYSLIALYTVFMTWGLFFSPNTFRKWLFSATKLPLLKRFRRKAVEQGNEMVVASKELRGVGVAYYIKISLLTIFVWSSRYLVVNCLFAAYSHAFGAKDLVTGLGGYTHLDAYAKQVVLWISQLMSITPGAAGLAELFFKEIYAGYTIPGVLPKIILIWRLITYYPYLIMGAIYLPRWLKSVLSMDTKTKKDPTTWNKVVDR